MCSPVPATPTPSKQKSPQKQERTNDHHNNDDELDDIKDGFFPNVKHALHQGSGMRMEHISEAFTAGACDMNDELRMRALTAKFLQTLYVASQRQLGSHAGDPPFNHL